MPPTEKISTEHEYTHSSAATLKMEQFVPTNIFWGKKSSPFCSFRFVVSKDEFWAQTSVQNHSDAGC